ncbi:hypothetical protein SAMN05444005_102346 [Flavobacterium urocaniciphilum]|uniref:Head domain of trimeric autotransporter adhesin n=2 Tax=Flavobacterium urocaniciphilum TaxID=1299341 RepID=A0A1H9AWR3_9FLAO|nr:hypothetical protein SAMN05444005_102346 [Flavobacterium urocaniciphilum]
MKAQVGVGTTTPAGALDINSSTNGLVLPRVALTALNVATPVVNPQGGSLVIGTLVWNTATAGSIPNNVVPGMYYWDGTKWISLAGSPGGLDWSLSGNTGTNPATNYVGTTDNVPLILRANSIERIRMGTTETVVNEDAQNYNFRVEGTGESQMFFVDAANNHVHIRAASPFPTIDMFTSVASGNDYPINGYAVGQGNAGIYGRHSVDASATTMNAGGAFDGAGNGFSTQAGWNVGAVGTGREAGLVGTATNAASNNDQRQGGYFSVADTGTTIQATASIAGRESGGSGKFYGGFFDGGQSTNDYAYVGMRSGGTDYGILSAGTKSTMVKDNDGKNRVMYCTEAPEVLFQDFGEAELINGKAVISLDEVLSKNISDKKPVKVFIQLEGDCNGVFISNKSNKGFTVTELNNGKSNTKFSWQIIGNRADATDNKGKVTSEFDDVRFPIGPEKINFPKPGTSKVEKR